MTFLKVFTPSLLLERLLCEGRGLVPSAPLRTPPELSTAPGTEEELRNDLPHVKFNCPAWGQSGYPVGTVSLPFLPRGPSRRPGSSPEIGHKLVELAALVWTMWRPEPERRFFPGVFGPSSSYLGSPHGPYPTPTPCNRTGPL